jgi:hypothetical protein
MQALSLNLVLAWIWVFLGFLSGLVLGLNFHREDWLGGYGSFKRRMYRLAHISFFGLAAANVMFYFTARFALNGTGILTMSTAAAGSTLAVASWAFAIGALSMPACCILTAHATSCRLLFAVPVTSLLLASLLTLWKVIGL